MHFQMIVFRKVVDWRGFKTFEVTITIECNLFKGENIKQGAV